MQMIAELGQAAGDAEERAASQPFTKPGTYFDCLQKLSLVSGGSVFL